MDWAPQTPPPVHNPYQGDYMPGGWPVDPPTPPPLTAGTFAVRRPATGLLPFAKRVCQGLGTIVKRVAVTASRHTVDATTVVATVPAYYIVRSIQQQRRNRRAQQQSKSQLKRRAERPALPPLSDSPWKRLVANADNQNRELPQYLQESAQNLGLQYPQESTRRTIFPPTASPRVTAPPPPKSDHPVVQYGLYEIPELRPAYVLEGIKHAKNAAAQSRRQRSRKPSLFPGMPKFTPPRQPKPAQLPTPDEQLQKPLPEIAKLETPYPPLQPIPDTTPSVTANEDSAATTPSNQLQEQLAEATESDSDSATVVSHTWHTRKRRREAQGSREGEGEETPQTAKRIQLEGPSSRAPESPTPVVVVHETLAAVSADAPNTPNTSLLSPPRVRRRRVSTPRSSKTQHIKSPESDISSTCDCSPGDLPQINGTSPDESFISSTYNGSPPDPDEDARLFKMIMAGGGSPTSLSKTFDKVDKEAKTLLSNPGTVPEARENEIPNQKESAAPRIEADPNTKAETNNTVSKDETPQTVLTPTQKNIASESDDAKEKVKPEGSTTPAQEAINASESNNIKSDDSTAQHSNEIATSDSVPRTPTRAKQQPLAPDSINVGSVKETKKPDQISFETPERKLAKLTLEDQYDTDVPTPKATPHSSEKGQRITRAESKRLQILEEKQHYDIAPLTPGWEERVQTALRHGHGEYKATDLTRVVPLSQGRGTDNWLNDEVINGYLKLIIAHGKLNDRPTQVPTHHAFVSFFYNNLESRGYDSVKRWASRAKIGGKSLLETEQVFIPINSGMHWTLCVVSGKNKTITHYNSLRGNGRRYVETVTKWVKEELGSAYKEEEWKLDFQGESPQQANMDDCGVFTITSARQIMLGLTPMSYGANQIPLQRKRIVAELVNGGLIKSNE